MPRVGRGDPVTFGNRERGSPTSLYPAVKRLLEAASFDVKGEVKASSIPIRARIPDQRLRRRLRQGGRDLRDRALIATLTYVFGACARPRT